MPILNPSDATVHVTVAEPTTNVDGTPLTDLADVKVYYHTGTGPEAVVALGATTPQGGGILRTDIIADVAAGEVKTIYAQAIAINKLGLESARSTESSLLIDRTAETRVPAAPGPVTLF